MPYRLTEQGRSWGCATQVFGNLAGRWSLSRVMDDGAASIKGAATFSPAADGRLAYHERVRTTLVSGAEFDGERRYLFAPEPDGFSVLFAETPVRFFHAISLEATAAGWAGDAVHWCRDDRYDSRYVFRGDGTFTIRHAVQGPRKHYALTATYRRISVIQPPMDSISVDRMPFVPAAGHGGDFEVRDRIWCEISTTPGTIIVTEKSSRTC